MTRHRARPSFTVEIKRSRTSPLIATPDSERPQSERPASKPPASPAATGEPERRPAAPGRNLWAGTGLFEEAAAATQSGRFDPPEAPAFAKDSSLKSPAAKDSSARDALARDVFSKPSPAAASDPRNAGAKRVLPSLIAPPEPEPEPEAAPEPEPKLPRVRRYRTAAPAQRRTPGPRPAFVWPEDWPDEAPIQTPAPIALPAAPRIQAAAPQPEAPQSKAPVAEAAETGEMRLRAKRRAGDEDLRVGQRWKRRLPRVCW
ncbi:MULTISPECIES: hypothetical protein [Methylobacterium]|jgi:hypothetical protein|uniref:Uncharacterized protein n=2 Tax=Methylobacterium TaxID=407 RepID=A0A0C6F1P1_9HYPH|nr:MULTISPECIES: hypothetical protein [Methylobacterium]MBK3397585.1 hypothetical protein [Methylobacterium ajmalii]MBK3411616.1 hypothetical protein [Methylobacterium ajmalii]BAQ46536.1 hypothetical protein Maq22A_c17080 [Methylobacterium aquaticum]SFF49041.1 hypothetical protein SAMN04487844_12250 [Methylobacterium sp. yr596]